MYVMYLSMYVCMYISMYVCMHVCEYACMHACMYVFILRLPQAAIHRRHTAVRDCTFWGVKHSEHKMDIPLRFVRFV